MRGLAVRLNATRMKTFPLAFLLVLASTAALQARVDLLLVPPDAPVDGKPGVAFTLYLNNPTELAETAHLPAEFVALYASRAGHGRVRLRLDHPGDTERAVAPMSRETVVLRLDEPIPGGDGFVSLRLANPSTNAIMFALASPAPAVAGDAVADSAADGHRRPIIPGRHLDLTSDIENMRRHISSYDPIYFAVGWRERFNARFQFSFKYRVFDRGPPGEPWLRQLARDFYMAYTQTSIWDLESFSKPFYDSSYKPTAFILHEFDRDGSNDWRFSLQAGAQHESNGKGGGAAPTPGSSGGLLSPTTALRHPSDTRSLNTLYLAPTVRWMAGNDFFVEAKVRASALYQSDENPDIGRYRGHVELTLRTGYDRGFQFSAHARGTPQAHGSLELNMTWPAIETPLLKLVLPPSLGGYAQVQYFNGYGESLLDYDVRRKDQLRFGLMIVR